MFRSLILALSVVFVFSCGETSFNSNGGTNKKTEQSTKEKPTESDDLTVETESITPSEPSIEGGTEISTDISADISTDKSTDVSVPDSAVTKGIFTVWTVPEDPRPLENYDIYIKVSGKVDLNVIEGNVEGTDLYYQSFSTDGKCDSNYSGDLGSDIFGDVLPEIDSGFCVPRVVSSNSAETVISVPVPGAENLVKDIVEVKLKNPSGSIIAQEKLELIF